MHATGCLSFHILIPRSWAMIRFGHTPGILNPETYRNKVRDQIGDGCVTDGTKIENIVSI